MSVRIIQERLESYQCQTAEEEHLALAEIIQEIFLGALSRAEFFKKAAFQGGTCLRILYGSERFSEDLDFILKKSTEELVISSYLENVRLEFAAYGLHVNIQDRTKVNQAVKKVFLKDQSIGKVLHFKFSRAASGERMIKVKLEIDTRPPRGSGYEEKYLDFPFPFAVSTQDLPSLFAGKSHALLCRPFVKGRDWYDFIWYVGRSTSINFEFLSHAIEQMGPWRGQKISINKRWYLKEMKKRIQKINFEDAKKDVSHFLKPHQLPSLELWKVGYFLDRLKKMEEYL